MELLMRRKQDPDLRWRDYFNELGQNFAVDGKLVRRHKWRKAILQRPRRKIMMAQ